MTAPQSTGSAGGAATLCERPIALAKDVLRRRIYAPTAYATARNLAVVPIVPSECLALCILVSAGLATRRIHARVRRRSRLAE